MIPTAVCLELGRVGTCTAVCPLPMFSVVCSGVREGASWEDIVAGSLSETERPREQPGWFVAGGQQPAPKSPDTQVHRAVTGVACGLAGIVPRNLVGNRRWKVL